jgi:O-antigen/teichoic acid export membrane protein
MAEWTALGNLLQPAIFLLITRRFGVFSLLRARFLRMRFVREFVGFSSAAMASQLSGLLISGLDLPIVAAWDFHNAGYYALAALVSNMLVVPQGAVLTTIVPMMSAMTMGEQAERMGRVLLRTTRLATALLITVAVPLMLGMPALLQLWVGADYARHTLFFGELLVGAQAVRLCLTPYALIGFSAGEQRHMLASPIVEGIVNLAASLVLVRIMGAAGVAVGTLLGAVVGIGLHFFVSMNRTPSMAFRRRDLFNQGILRPIAWAVAPAGVAGCCMLAVSSVPGELLLAAMTFFTLCALLWKVHLAPEERAAVRELAGRVLTSRQRLPAKAIGVER